MHVLVVRNDRLVRDPDAVGRLRDVDVTGLLSARTRGHSGASPWYQASPNGSWKQVMSPRMRIIPSNAVEVERRTAHSARIRRMFVTPVRGWRAAARATPSA